MRKRNKKSYIFLVVLAGMMLLLLLCFRTVLTDGSSMEPTYTPGDLLLCVRSFHKPEPGDVVLIEHNGKLMIKRVAAVAGQTAVTPAADDQPLESSQSCGIYTYYSTDLPLYAEVMGWQSEYWTQYFYWDNTQTATIPKGYIFVVGDNLANSYDSRNPDYGLVSEDEIQGYIICKIR